MMHFLTQTTHGEHIRAESLMSFMAFSQCAVSWLVRPRWLLSQRDVRRVRFTLQAR